MTPSSKRENAAAPGPAGQPARWIPRGWAAVLVLCALATLPYLNSLRGSFHFDDNLTITRNRSLGRLGDVVAAAPTPRLLTHLTFFANYQLHGIGFLPGWHLTNILLHASCVLAVFWCFGLLWAGGRRSRPIAPFLGAALFAVHPLATEPVNYIEARAVILYTLFSVLALCGAVMAHRRGLSRRAIPAAVLAVAALVFAAVSKEVGILFAAALPMLYVLVFVSGEVRGKRRFWLWAAAATGGFSLAVIFWLVFGGMWHAVAERINPMFWHHLLGQATVFWRYVSLVLLPLPARLNVDHYVGYPEFVRYSLDQGDVLLAVLGLAASLGAVVWLARRRPRISLFTAIVFVGLAPYFVLTSQEMMVEYRMYLPLVGFCGLGGAALGALVRRSPRLGLSAAAALGVLFIAAVLVRNTAWRTDISIWEDAARKSPRKARTINGLAWALATAPSAPDPKRALDLALKSMYDRVNLVPWPGDNPFMWDTLAEAYYVNGMYEKAIEIESRFVNRGIPDGGLFQDQLDKYRKAQQAAEKR